jgi:hypothetical protein
VVIIVTETHFSFPLLSRAYNTLLLRQICCLGTIIITIKSYICIQKFSLLPRNQGQASSSQCASHIHDKLFHNLSRHVLTKSQELFLNILLILFWPGNLLTYIQVEVKSVMTNFLLKLEYNLRGGSNP